MKKSNHTSAAAPTPAPRVYTGGVEHEGVAYPSRAALARHLGLPVKWMNNRLQRGWTEAQAFGLAAKPPSKAGHRDRIAGHLVTQQDRALAASRGISLATLRSRLSRMPLTEAMKRPVKAKKDWKHAKPLVAFGRSWPSLAELARAYQVAPATFQRRIRRQGLTPEQAALAGPRSS